MSRYGDLEAAIVERIESYLPEVKAVAVAEPGHTIVENDPVAELCWGGATEVESSSVINGVVRLIVNIPLVVIISIRRDDDKGVARLGTVGVYEYLDQLRSALIGFQPVVQSIEAVWPLTLVREETFLIDQGLYGVGVEFNLKMQFSEGVP